MAFDIFQKLAMSIFIDSEWFIINTSKLLKLNYELKDFYDSNVDEESKMVPPNGDAFKYSKEELNLKQIIIIWKFKNIYY